MFAGYYLQIFFGLLTASHQELGFEDVTFPGWAVDNILGHGGFCTVFSAHKTGTTRGPTHAIKKFADAKKCDHERGVLKFLNEYRLKHIPKLEGEGGTHHLVLSPIGKCVRPINKDTFTSCGDHGPSLVRCLHAVHDIGFVHRDVKPSNVFLVEDGNNIILNDWGSACRHSAGEMLWEGTIGYSVISGMSRVETHDGPPACYHTPTPADDLVSLVRTIYSMLTAFSPPRINPDDFWRLHLKGSMWQKMLRYAEATQYDELAECMKEL